MSVATSATTFSIALCTFNGARFVGEQLASLAAQTRLPDELIVCDDGSSDATISIVKDFAAQAAFPVKLFRNEQRLGSTKNFEQAILRCSGDLIALSDQDDVWKAEKLSLLEAEFQKHPNVGLVFTDAEIVDDRLQPTGRRMWNEVGFRDREKQMLRQGRALEVLLPGWRVTGATLAFRATFRDLILPFPTDLAMIHDGWIALMIATVAEVEFIDEPMIFYRQHAQQQIGAPPPPNLDVPESPITLESLNKAAARPNSYDHLVRTIETVRQRLRNRANDSAARKSLAYIDTWLKHMKVRMNLPTGIASRFLAVAKELLAMRYHRYSNGTASATKDLVYGAKVM